MYIHFKQNIKKTWGIKILSLRILKTLVSIACQLILLYYLLIKMCMTLILVLFPNDNVLLTNMSEKKTQH